MFEIIVPFGEDSPMEDGLYDDCPYCQRLKEELEKGNIEKDEGPTH